MTTVGESEESAKCMRGPCGVPALSRGGWVQPPWAESEFSCHVDARRRGD